MTAEETKPAEAGCESFKAPDLSLTTVLLIEDQPQILALMADCMRVLGVGQVIPVGSAGAAVELVTCIQNNPTQVGVSHIDFAVVDWNLEGNPFATKARDNEDDGAEVTIKQGPEVCRWLRQIEFCRFMPILGVSAYSSKSCVTDMIDAGVNGFMSKPFTIHDLGKQVQTLVAQLRIFVVTPSGYHGPDRRRKVHEIETERRRSQNGVKKFTPPRALRQKTAALVDIPETNVVNIMKSMREIEPPDYTDMVGYNVERIQETLDKVPKAIENDEQKAEARENLDLVNAFCNEILENPGGFTYQMVAETVATLSRFIADKHFMPTVEAHALLQQQLTTLSMILSRNMKGPARGEMRGLFTETFLVIERMLKDNRQKDRGLWL